MLRALELFCGIGGVAATLGEPPLGEPPLEGRLEVAAAIDIHRGALEVYRVNFPVHRVLARNLETLGSAELAAFEADLWWLSPPCQPFTVRGRRRDADDPRARPFLAMIERLAEVRPAKVALENVAGFQGSRVHQVLLETLGRTGYGVRERLFCPTELGVPNRRPRYYLVASLGSLPAELATEDVSSRAQRAVPLAYFLDPWPEPGLAVEPELLRRYEGALHVADADDPDAVTNCFTSAYGRSHVRSGSYLRQHGRVRRFSPREILRLLGFPSSYALPSGLGRSKAWRLVGNSLSLFAVRRWLAAIVGEGAAEAA